MNNKFEKSDLYELIKNIRNRREMKSKYFKKDCPETCLHIKTYRYTHDAEAGMFDNHNLFIICDTDFDILSKIMIDICDFSSHKITIFYDENTCLLKEKYRDINNYIIFCSGTDIGDALQLFSSTPEKIEIKYINISDLLNDDKEYKNFKSIFYESLYLSLK